MKLKKKSVGEKDRRGNYTNWVFLVNGVEIAEVGKGFKGVCGRNSRLITHYRISYSFHWKRCGLEELFGCQFDIRGLGHWSSDAHTDLWNDYSAHRAPTRLQVVEDLNRALERKGLEQRVS